MWAENRNQDVLNKKNVKTSTAIVDVLVMYYGLYVSFRSPSLFYLLTVGVAVVYFHMITDTHHSR
jgi:hypothetical protein